ncbi:heparinase II/III family protein [Aurantimonas sp. DM33-3]|uniref:heparinase II/III family protein n=1 Tax=Aurantimonas sp. DM33-3 TaxID=2766955 RepID=UPI00165281F5|nr:heparinase II/III family protein [Aurantimonas sp. DM33-3]MBC6718447.1 heparinase II/III family protein [Aurantimonas sp. DM33-3]
MAGQPLLAVLTLREVWRRARRRLRTGPLHRWRFAGGRAGKLLVVPPSLRHGDPMIAEAIYAGRFFFAGQLLEPGRTSIFQATLPSEAYAAELHGFDWLRHHAEAGDALAVQNARTLVDDWIRQKGGTLADPAFEPAVAARRMIAWLSHADMLLADADAGFHKRFLRSLSSQARYLRSVAQEAPEGTPRLQVRTALAFVSLCLPAASGRIKIAARHLAEELDRQVFPDGGHISRDPAAPVAILADLIPLRQTYLRQGQALPRGLYSAIDRMLPAVRFFRHSDGSLALFNGSGASDIHLMTVLLRYDETLGEPITHARQSGYHRLAAGSSVIVADTGCPPPALVSRNAHAGTLGFELSCEANRIVVNCGRPLTADAEWRRLSRSTAAHSTVTLDDRSSSHFARSESLDRFLGTPLVPGPTEVLSGELGDPVRGFEANHNGYERQSGLLHRRQVSLAEDGWTVEGHDSFQRSATVRTGSDAGKATARFHLHPSVSVELIGDGVRLAVRGQRWLFRADARVEIEDSIFFADAGGARRTLQLAVPFDAYDPAGIAWRFEREA